MCGSTSVNEQLLVYEFLLYKSLMLRKSVALKLSDNDADKACNADYPQHYVMSITNEIEGDIPLFLDGWVRLRMCCLLTNRMCDGMKQL